MVKVIKKGKIPVDPSSGLVATGMVLDDYNCTLNQVNIGNNNNKFYVIQVIQHPGGYMTFTRWGRVGEVGQNAQAQFSDKNQAIREFEAKFRDKTKNNWANRDNFVSHDGKYTLIHMDYGDDDDNDDDGGGKAKKNTTKTTAAAPATAPVVKTASKLDLRVQKLIEMIFDMKMMETTLTSMEYDINKMPLGKLKKKTILEAYEALKELDGFLKNGGTRADIERCSNRFYTLIPHAYGRGAPPPLLKTTEDIKRKIQMLDTLADIEIATTLLSDTTSAGSTKAQVDINYEKLKCGIEPVDEKSAEYAAIAKYVENTHEGHTPKIVHIYRINREGEEKRYESGGKKLGNRKLLWHGSRLSNFVGIISQGLRIAPPEAPASGYRFGKGVYFADMMSLSTRYCRAGGSKEELCMLLADVALGKCAELEKDQFMTQPIAGSNSTHALGRIEPGATHINLLPLIFLCCFSRL